jgi:hypothetical protein
LPEFRIAFANGRLVVLGFVHGFSETPNRPAEIAAYGPQLLGAENQKDDHKNQQQFPNAYAHVYLKKIINQARKYPPGISGRRPGRYTPGLGSRGLSPR